MLRAPLRKRFFELCGEDVPMVRRACAARLGDFSAVLEKHHLISSLLPVFLTMTFDE